MKNLRDHVYSARRKGKDYRKVQAELKERFDVPDSWFQGVFDDEVHQADSLADAALDLYIDEREIHAGAGDACRESFGERAMIAGDLIRETGRILKLLEKKAPQSL